MTRPSQSAEKRSSVMALAQDRAATGQFQLAQAIIVVEREPWHACFDRDAIDASVLRKSSTDETSFSVKTDVRPARKRPIDEDVLSGQHGGGKAPIRVEVQRQMQIFAAGAGNAIYIDIARQVESADALVEVEPHQRSAKTRQAVDLLIRAQCHTMETPILASKPVHDAGVRGEPPRAENPLAR
jgi:hypothetical protein